MIFNNKLNLDNSLDQKKLSEYNLSSILDKLQGTPAKSKEISIEEEIKFLTKLSLLVQEKNEKYKNMIEEKIKNNTGYQTIDEEFDYEIDTKQTDIKNNISIQKKNKKLEKIDVILKNSAYHIYKMQLTQFAESIKRIYKNSKNNQYFISSKYFLFLGILFFLIGVKLLFFFVIFIELGLTQFSLEINPERISLFEYLSLIEIKF